MLHTKRRRRRQRHLHHLRIAGEHLPRATWLLLHLISRLRALQEKSARACCVSESHSPTLDSSMSAWVYSLDTSTCPQAPVCASLPRHKS
jgi:hypothetical protein